MIMTPQQEAQHDQPRNPLHGITLERMLHELVQQFGWAEMARRIRIRCFATDPSIASSLKFLRKTSWAREEVESLYLFMLRERERERKRASQVTPQQAQNEGS